MSLAAMVRCAGAPTPMSNRESIQVGLKRAPESHCAGQPLALAALVGTSIEWYDFFLYATAAALVFPTVFFPATLSPFVALIASFSTFAVGFIARPLGAALFGHLGDRAGRKMAFAVSLTMMGTATALIGILPAYSTVGAVAPLALVLLRLLQGLAVGGQWGGALLLATESAPSSRRGLFAGVAQAGVPIGVVLANLAFLVANATTSPAGFVAHGWRIPFLLSIGLVGLAALIHVRLEDTEAFKKLKRAEHDDFGRSPRCGRVEPSPVLAALRQYPRLIFTVAGTNVAGILGFYVLITYVVAYGTSAAGLQLPRATVLSAVLIANLAMIPAELLSGQLSDSLGRRRLIAIGLVLLASWSFLLFPLMHTRSLVWISLGVIIGQCLTALIHAPVSALTAEVFDTRVRYSAASLSYQLSSVAGGALAPIIASALYARFLSTLSISIYMTGACLLSLGCLALLPRAQDAESDRGLEPTPSL